MQKYKIEISDLAEQDFTYAGEQQSVVISDIWNGRLKYSMYW